MDDLARRARHAAERVLEDEKLTDNLEDDAAKTLIEWGIACAEAIARSTDDASDTFLERLQALRRLMRTVNEWIPARESAAPQQADTYVTQIVEQAAAVYGERFVRPTAEQWEAFVGHFSAPHSTPTQAIAALRALVEQPVRKGFEVRVKLFATLRRHYPHLGIGEAMPVTVEEGATIDSLVVQLGLPPRQVKVVFVNGIVREGSYPLAEGDELGIFPPVGGG